MNASASRYAFVAAALISGIPDPVLASGDYPGPQPLDEELCGQLIDFIHLKFIRHLSSS